MRDGLPVRRQGIWGRLYAQPSVGLLQLRQRHYELLLHSNSHSHSYSYVNVHSYTHAHIHHTHHRSRAYGTHGPGFHCHDGLVKLGLGDRRGSVQG